jgi:hypothetical protein
MVANQAQGPENAKRHAALIFPTYYYLDNAADARAQAGAATLTNSASSVYDAKSFGMDWRHVLQ